MIEQGSMVIMQDDGQEIVGQVESIFRDADSCPWIARVRWDDGITSNTSLYKLTELTPR